MGEFFIRYLGCTGVWVSWWVCAMDVMGATYGESRRIFQNKKS